MIDERDRFERAFDLFQPPDSSWDRMLRRRARKQRNKRIATVFVALAIAAIGIAGPLVLFRSAGPEPATQTPAPIRHGDELVVGYPGHGFIGVDPATLHTRLIVDTSSSPMCDDGCYAAWSADGRWLAWVRSDGGPPPYPNNGLWVLRAGGHPVHLSNGNGLWSPVGAKIASADGEPGGRSTLTVFDLDSGSRTRVASTTSAMLVTWSPGGDRIALTDGASIEVVAVAGGTPAVIANDAHRISSLDWSPAGDQIIFVGRRRGVAGLYILPADGSGTPQLLQEGVQVATWSPDGDRIAYSLTRGCSLCTMSPRGGKRVDASAKNSCQGSVAVWSPDGTEIACQRADQSWVAVPASDRAKGRPIDTLQVAEWAQARPGWPPAFGWGGSGWDDASFNMS